MVVKVKTKTLMRYQSSSSMAEYFHKAELFVERVQIL